MNIFRLTRSGLFAGALVAIVAGLFAGVPVVHATSISPSNQQAGAYAVDPPLGVAGAAPLVMLNLSRDHQLFYKAFNDFTDLNNDGTVDTTYNNAITYAGYFDSTKCYAYNDTNGYFVPKAVTTTHYCTSQWSGNFLNWAAMTRMDEVRQILYGGYRVPSMDTTSLTVLERAHLPMDAHSFAKYYNGDDISKLTTFSPTTVSTLTGQKPSDFYWTSNATVTENASTKYWLFRTVKFPTSLKVQAGDQVRIVGKDASGGTLILDAPVRFINNGYTGDSATDADKAYAKATAARVELRVQAGMLSGTLYSSCSSTDIPGCLAKFKDMKTWDISNFTRQGISFCNTTPAGAKTLPLGSTGSTTYTYSQGDDATPRLRVATGDMALWASNESKQCQWRSEASNSQSGFADGFFSNGNRYAFSGLNSSAENPANTGTKGTDWAELNVRVQVCVANLIGAENCKKYPDDKAANPSLKPVGLLQKYGEAGAIKFGLMTPSFDRNASGGILRAALPDAGKNTGDFISNEIDPATGIVRTGTGIKGIIKNINALRIYGYLYGASDNYGDKNANGCTFQQIGITSSGSADGYVGEGNCSSWGNPMAESYIETLRYLAGKQSPTGAFNKSTDGTGTQDAAIGLTVATWNKPVTQANFCAALNVINFNASSLSYDTNQTDGFDDLKTGRSVSAWTDLVGTGEGINGNSWFVGNVRNSDGSGTQDSLCSAKTISGLSTAYGICPESPALQGGYLMAGAAYGAHINRIMDLGKDPSTGLDIVPADDRSSLKVSTYGVQLATNTPTVRVKVPGSTGKYITIIPAYRLVLKSGFGGGQLVDFKILSQTQDATTATGKFYAVWEDSFAGGDYDQDMWGTISYEITKDTVRITTKAVAASTNNGQGFGYVISGTTQDGPHFHSGIYDFKYSDPANITVQDQNGVSVLGKGIVGASGGCDDCTVSNPATTGVYSIGSTNASALKDPLLYAAKWGGFRADQSKPDGQDTPANDADPNDNSKWTSSADGTPDNYFLVTDPSKLQSSLDALFRKILAKVASGTAAATVATSANGTGVTYQALYEGERTDTTGRRATWIGSLTGLWTDQHGLLREDGNHNGQLDDYNTDPVITYTYQVGGGKTVANRFTSSSNDTFKPSGSSVVELSDLNTLWNVRTQLFDPTMSAGTQRTYTDAETPARGRYVFTWVDANLNGRVDAGEVVPFLWDSTGSASLNKNNFRFLNSDTTTEAQNIISWVRGVEVTGMRNRTVDYGTATNQLNRVARLGDIVNSTPLAVGAPAESYDLLYNDSSYAAFRDFYRYRRQMVYVGANDGMIHAFNGGFYNTSCQRFTTQPSGAVCTDTNKNVADTVIKAVTTHPLGSEVWAYVPGNELPHLRWLTDPNYAHTYYVDGSPVAFDVKTFKPDTTTHIQGWGTVLVVPFRLGGGAITVPTSTDAKDPKPFTAQSSYVVLDVTDPESPPTVLAELSFPSTWTTSAPAMAVVRDPVSEDPSKFFLALGSGPTDITRVGSTQNLQVKVYDMADLTAATPVINPKMFDLGTIDNTGKTSFAGDLIASDFNLDDKAEALYFGSVFDRGTSTSEFGGQFWKIAINGDPAPANWVPSLMLNLTDGTTAPAGMPVTVRPTLARNDRGAPMVFFGTGRLFSSTDKATAGQQRVFGMIDTSLLTSGDPQADTKVQLSNLIDITGLNVFADKSITGIDDNPLIPSGTATFDALQALFDTGGVAGWFRNLQVNDTNPSERVVSAQTLLGDILLTATYIPGTSICTGLGASYLVGSNYKTGTATPGAPIFGNASNGRLNDSMSLGQGMPAPPSLHAGDDSTDRNGSKTVTACTQTSTGAIVCKDVATLKPVTSGETSWREPLGNK
jgi:Tfp pilus assembly protein, tip-associated adhesin PilY1